jgi:D-alanyl-D-alanine carboxypeptidase
MSAAPAAATGPYQIQVGAYATESDARRQIDQVKTQTGALLSPFAGVVIAATANGKTVYRARYTGFDTANGGTVCNELRRRQIDCMVAKAE